MFVEFQFWKYLFNRKELIQSLDHATIRHFRKRVWFVAFLGVLLFALQAIWGMNTRSLTTIFVEGYENTYSIARIVSFIGTIIWSVLYMGFHFFGMAFLLHKITHVRFSKVAVLQLYVVALLLLEKALIFIIFVIVGYTTAFSVLSFGPLAASFLTNEFWIYFFNQLTIITAFIITVQFQFLRAFTAMTSRNLLLVLLTIHIILALLTAGISLLEVDSLFERWSL